MPAPRQVYNLTVPASDGPWKGGRHPGLVISDASDGAGRLYIVVPFTGTKPQRPRPTTQFELVVKCGDLDPPLWLLCEHLTNVPASSFDRLTMRGVLSTEDFAVVKNKLMYVLNLLADRNPGAKSKTGSEP